MTLTIIIIFCSLLLFAYLFDITSSKTKIPAVILLLLLGWIVKQLTLLFEFDVPELTSVLPVFGTIGLILIVLEGSLELELDRSKLALIRKSFIGAVISLLVLSFLLAGMFHFFGNFSFRDSLVNAIPFCVISSAIAIPSVRNLSSSHREFVIYESSLSDIAGVLFFNFVALNATYSLSLLGTFGLQLLGIALVSVVAILGLSFLLHRIEHHIKYIPIILLVILIYSVSEYYHLPALIFILLFGLFLGNLNKLRNFKLVERFNPEELEREVSKFRELTIEGAFMVRAIFFLLFGYLIETAEILNTDTLIWSSVIVFAIFAIRALQLKLSGIPFKPLFFVAPRGLITIVLFLMILPEQNILHVNKSLIVQVILLTTVIMMFGLMATKKEKKKSVNN
ncbi:MAG: sodium:proton antiporter [Bacteroidetes bacterium GWF2_40_14]|nr:MAG: sodium:proton antiporter [Bacteroidetes bacterium GWF2_40_14]